MSTTSKSGNIKVQSTIDELTCRAIDKMAEIGVKGSNRAEVIAFLLRNWVEYQAVQELEKYEILDLKLRPKVNLTNLPIEREAKE